MTRSPRNPTGTPADAAWVELDARRLGAAELRLMWRRQDGAVALALADLRRGGWLGRRIPPAQAATAFRHPLGYLGPGTDARPASRAGDELPEPAGVDVDQLWLSELADETLTGLSELLRLRAEEDRGDDGGV